MIALILGGAPSVWRDLAEAQALLNRRHLVVAANLAGIHWRGRLDGWVSYHSDRLGEWAAERAAKGGNTDFRAFTPSPAGIPTEIVSEAWDGSSGLYAVRCALFEMGAAGAICCGIPLIREAGHFRRSGQWEPVTGYHQEWDAVSPILGDRVRSMGGWTEANFGRPTPEWVDAIDNTTPLGVIAAPGSREMHEVTNNTQGTQSFWARNPDGSDRRVHLGPGDSETCEINTDDPTFQGKDLTVKKVPDPEPEASPKPARRR